MPAPETKGRPPWSPMNPLIALQGLAPHPPQQGARVPQAGQIGAQDVRARGVHLESHIESLHGLAHDARHQAFFYGGDEGVRAQARGKRVRVRAGSKDEVQAQPRRPRQHGLRVARPRLHQEPVLRQGGGSHH